MTRRLRSLLLVFGLLISLSVAALPRLVEGAQSRAATITLTYLRHDFPPGNALETQLIKQYEAMHRNVVIKMSIVPDAQLFTKFQALSTAGSPPDIIDLGDTYAPELVSRNLLAPIDFSAVGASSLAQLEKQYIPNALSGYTFGGKLYALPHELSDYVMWINARQFKAAHLSTDDYPHTWEQMAAIGKKLTVTRSGKTVQEGLALPFNFPPVEFFVLDAMARQAGGSLFSADGRHAYLDSPAVVKAVTTLSSFVRPDMISDPALNGTTAGAERTLFATGVASMIVDAGTWFRPYMQQQYAKVNAVAQAVPYPRFRGGPNTAGDLYGYGLVVDAHSAHQADAWQFIHFMLSHGADYFQKTGIYLGDKATLTSKVARSFPNWNVFASELARGQYAPRLVHFAEVSDIVGRAVDSIILNHQDPKQTLSSVQSQITSLLNS